MEEQKEFLQSNPLLSAQELASTVKFLRKQMTPHPSLKDAMDICGTGGSGLPRINTSTISAFILSSLGVPIAKHGNNASSGRFGSFDLLEALEVEPTFKKHNLVFLHAKKFHPAMRFFAEARKSIKTPTFFNIIGPLLNPANTKIQIIGTPFKDKMKLIAETCKLLGKKHVVVVCGEDRLDEITITGKTFITELKNNQINSYTISPKDFGIKKATFSEIKGGNSAFNIQITKTILNSECKSRHLDLVLANSAMAIFMAKKAKTLQEGYSIAKQAVVEGLALRQFVSCSSKNILSEIVLNKIKEVAILPEITTSLPLSTRDFKRALKQGKTSIIAEIKQKSPSKGAIKKVNASSLAKHYEKNGAAAISVLCDKKFFGGSFAKMKQAAIATKFTPILCKDFIISSKQIFYARKNGADAILLISSILTKNQITSFYKLAKSLGMDSLCEVNTQEDLLKALQTPVEIIGINNRDLNTFTTDLKTTTTLSKLIPPNKIIVSESGIHTSEDLLSLPKKVDAALIGTSIMQGYPLTNFTSPQLKICGIRTIKDALFCEKAGVDFIGLNLVESSHRKISAKKTIEICKATKIINKVGVFQNPTISEIKKAEKHLDFIQLCGNESIAFIKKCQKPVIKTISIKTKSDITKAKKYLPHVAFIILDGVLPGSGNKFNHNLIKNTGYPFFIAGGINSSNIKDALKTKPLGIDIASGAETNWRIDQSKIKKILNQTKSC